MKLNQKNIDTPDGIVSKYCENMDGENIDNFNYLYPNGHRMTHQMRWFKGSRDRGLKSYKVA